MEKIHSIKNIYIRKKAQIIIIVIIIIIIIIGLGFCQVSFSLWQSHSAFNIVFLGLPLFCLP